MGVAALADSFADCLRAAYWFMRAKGRAAARRLAEPPMIEVQEMAPAPVPRKDQLYAAAVPVASAPPPMHRRRRAESRSSKQRPSMLSKLASWRAPAAEAPTRRSRLPGPGAPCSALRASALPGPGARSSGGCGGRVFSR